MEVWRKGGGGLGRIDMRQGMKGGRLAGDGEERDNGASEEEGTGGCSRGLQRDDNAGII